MAKDKISFDKDKLESKTISELVKYMREQSGYTQQELARKINISHTSLSTYETEYSVPSLKTLQKVAKACDFKLLVLDNAEDKLFKVVNNKGNSRNSKEQ